MFHIVFNVDNNYIKYASVLMYSIVKNTDYSKTFKDLFDIENINSELLDYQKLKYEKLTEQEKSEGYVFHILSNYISEENINKIDFLQKELTCLYPCQIKIHMINDAELTKYPKFKGNYATYYRLKIGSILGKYTSRCLYLDADMLVFDDIRKIWILDITNYVMFCVNAVLGKNNFKSKTGLTNYISPDEFYFNSGFMFINIDEYNRLDIENQCFQFLTDYIVQLPDEHSLNAILKKKVLFAPYCYNFLAYFLHPDKENNRSDQKISFIDHEVRGGKYCYNLPLTKKELENFSKTIRVLHYGCGGYPKPWQSTANIDNNFTFKEYDLVNEWWSIACNTPQFGEKLIDDFIKLNNAKINILVKFFQKNIEEKNNLLLFQIKYGTAKTRIQNQLSYKLGQAMIINSKSLLGYIKMPFVLFYIKDKHNQEQKIYQEKIKKDPSLRLPPLEEYPDYKEALKEKECLTYKLGQALIKANKTWYGGGVYQVAI